MGEFFFFFSDLIEFKVGIGRMVFVLFPIHLIEDGRGIHVFLFIGILSSRQHFPQKLREEYAWRPKGFLYC